MFSNKCLLLSSMCCKFSLLLVLRDTTNVTFVQEFFGARMTYVLIKFSTKTGKQTLVHPRCQRHSQVLSLSLSHSQDKHYQKEMTNEQTQLAMKVLSRNFWIQKTSWGAFTICRCTLISPSSCSFPDSSKLRQVIKHRIVPLHRTVKKNTWVWLPVRAYWGFAKQQHPRKQNRNKLNNEDIQKTTWIK